MGHETSILYVTYIVHTAGDFMHRFLLEDLKKDDQIIFCNERGEVIDKDELIQWSIKNRKGFGYEVKEPLIEYRFTPINNPGQPFNYFLEMFNTETADDLFGVDLPQLERIRLELDPEHTYGGFLTLWDLYSMIHYDENGKDVSYEWYFAGVVNPKLLSEALFET